jgi:NADH-quinone oxidoreductase subunit J
LVADTVLFYVFAAIMVVASLLVVGQRSPIYSVLLLIVSFAALAGLYVLLDAPFLAVVQIIIYAGAIMVLFLFVVMLLNAPYEVTGTKRPPGVSAGTVRWAGVLLGVVLLLELTWGVWRATAGQQTREVLESAGNVEAVRSVREIGHVLFTQYGFAFEVTSVLILVAMVGAVVLAKREI